jgi:hypothetical protein
VCTAKLLVRKFCSGQLADEPTSIKNRPLRTEGENFIVLIGLEVFTRGTGPFIIDNFVITVAWVSFGRFSKSRRGVTGDLRNILVGLRREEFEKGFGFNGEFGKATPGGDI